MLNPESRGTSLEDFALFELNFLEFGIVQSRKDVQTQSRKLNNSSILKTLQVGLSATNL